LKLAGIAAAAPAAELGQILKDDYKELDGAIVASFALWSWSHTQPGANLSDVATPEARDLIDSLASRCINTDKGLFEDLPAGAEEKLINAIDPAKLEAQPAWLRIEKENTPGTLRTGPPLLIAQGTADNIIHPQTTAALVAGFCKAGRKVEFVSLPGVGHPTAGLEAAPRVADWAAGRFAGQSAPSTC
jgi:alpha-beta hydrolase superfamily lysophospholipase